MGWVGWDKENEIPDHSLPPFVLQVPEVQKGLGSRKREALTWSRLNGTFSFLHTKQFYSLKVKGKLWAPSGSWLREENGELMKQTGWQWSEKKVKPLHLCAPSCLSCLLITPKCIHQCWKKTHTKMLSEIISEWWEYRCFLMLSLYLFLYFSNFPK